MNCDLKFPQSGSLEDETREYFEGFSLYTPKSSCLSLIISVEMREKMTQKESCYRTGEYLQYKEKASPREHHEGGSRIA